MAFTTNLMRFVFMLVSLCSFNIAAQEYEKEWGIGATIRQASIPFKTESDSVSSFVPMMFFKNDHFFIKGLEAGAYIHSNEKHH